MIPGSLASQWAELFVPVALKASVLMLLLLPAAWLMRRASASARHLLWTLGVVALLLLPVMEASLPSLQVVPVPDTGWALPAAAQEVAAAPTAVQTSSAAEPAAPRPIAAWAFLLWLAGMAPLAVNAGWGMVRLHRFRREARALEEDGWPALLRELSRDAGLAFTPALLCSPRELPPMTWGIRRPVVLLPASCFRWAAERRREVLLHELAHVRRRDCLSWFAARLACTLYWFHPLVWVAARRMRIERERACDDSVLMAGARPSSYAGHLLEVACSLGGRAHAMPASLAMARRSKIFDRLDAVLDPARRRGDPGRRSKLALATMTLAVVVMLGWTGVTGTAADDTRYDTKDHPRTAEWTGDTEHGELTLAVRGEIEFNDENSWIISMAPGSFLVLEKKSWVYPVRVEVQPGEDGSPEFTYLVGRKERPFDREGRDWFSERLPHALRSMREGYDDAVAELEALEKELQKMLEEVTRDLGEERAHVRELAAEVEKLAAEKP